ncbi:hypothetical protein [Mangrovibacterium lignilyticum]|uniref:hypothetical protein n=1 Tax=Mangrovibacterium lignilyticum TaxID=2668052 RepID=UPI0013D240F4|nr:hypothetical protein [Mangrovibacterium lignilyticum]
MKRILTLTLIVFLALSLKAQENDAKEYLLFEFMQVPDENGSDYWDVESFWSGIHQQRVADKSIIGWDLWSLVPSGTKQGSQFLTVTIFPSLSAMLNAMNSLDVMGYAKKAYPDKTDEELGAMLTKTVKSRDMAHQVLFVGVDQTKDDFKMKVGTIVTLDIMKKLDDSYEKVESEIFKPWHQQMVEQGKKAHWGLLRTILPAGSQAYATNIAYSFYQNMNQLAEFMEGSGGEMDMRTKLAVSKGLETREWKEMRIGRLEMMVR